MRVYCTVYHFNGTLLSLDWAQSNDHVTGHSSSSVSFVLL